MACRSVTLNAAVFIAVLHSLLCSSQVEAQVGPAQSAPEFEPVFVGHTYVVQVNEDTQPGDIITHIRARDQILQTLVYSLDPWETNHNPPWIRPGVPNPDGRPVFTQDVYTINGRNGTVTAGTEVQPHIQLSGNFAPAFTYLCTAWYASNPALTSSIFVTFQSVDVNMPPLFTTIQTSYSMLFTESVGYVVTRFAATDPDLGPDGEVLFSMEQTVPDVSSGITYFQINQYTGHLILLHSLPLVEGFQITMVITVQDEGDMPLSSSLMITVTLARPSAQPPVFSAFIYLADVNEVVGATGIPSTAPVFVVGVNATDPGHDLTPIEYSIDNPEPEGDGVQFAIGVTTGVVIMWGPVDRERESRYIVHVQATKQGTALISMATVVVNVDDVNEPPLFLNTHYIAWVSEHANFGEAVHAFVSAVDQDEGQNGLLQYSITHISGRATVDGTVIDEAGSFAINIFTGAIFVNTDLERELMLRGIHYYEITVQVTDGGLETDTTLVTINITDVNDNPPFFVPFQYNYSLPENQLPANLFPFQAFDYDERERATLTFSLQGAFNERFAVRTIRTIHPMDHTRPTVETEGEFDVAVQLDREEVDIYRLLIVAEDITLTPLLGYANVTIFVLDVNDNCPEFVTDPKFVYNVSEGSLLPEDLFLGSYSVSDRDIGTNAEMEFSPQPNILNHFTITKTGSRTADLRIIQEFDRETTDFYQFSVTATDQGTPPCADSIDICVYIEDINDNPPIFNPVTYTYSLCEGATVGTTLVTVAATDQDFGHNREIIYSVASTEGLGLFTVDETTGVFSLAGEIDYERTGPSLVVQVVATDRGSPPLSATATVTITICDCNDNPPVVQVPVDNSCIVENSPTGIVVRTFGSTDADATAVNRIHNYEIESGGVDGAGAQVLCIPTITIPTITLCGPIDKEQPLDYISVTVLTSNPSTAGCGLVPSPVRTSYNICVSGVNDIPPTLASYAISTSIRECESAGAIVGQLQGSDLDREEEQTLRYTLVAPNNFPFVLDRTSGTITVSSAGLDFETQTSYTFSAFVEDGGTPNLQSAMSATISVTVLDCNDNAPVSTGPFTATIVEHTAPGTVVLPQLTYTDADTASDFAVARFIITGGAGNVFNHFALSTAGVLTVTADIDREQQNPSLILNGECQAVYELFIEVRDHLTGPVADQLFNTYTITIYVGDINDQTPVFSPTSLSILVAENNANPTAIDHALATDRDCGTNAQISYAITSQISTASNPLPMPYFDLVSSSDPTIRAIQVLDREATDNVFTIVVTGTDQGTPPLASTYTLTVTVSDINDHNPILACPAAAMLACTFNVPEDTPINTVIVNAITYTDADADAVHNTVTYAITNVPLPPFSIDPATGIISTTGALDCETISEYYLTVVGTDSSSTDPDHIRRGSIVVHIVCVDVNDECPVLQSGTMYTTSLVENTPAGTSVVLDPSIFATDADVSAVHRVLQYQLTSGTANFAMDSSTAAITTVASFDREITTQSMFQFTVTNPGCTGTPTSTTGTIVVTILDVNDNTPVWVPITAVTLAECVGITTAIPYTRPTDADANENGRIYYRFGETNDEDFRIDYETGDIRVFQELDRERRDSYSFDVIATDGGAVPLSASTTLTISITDCNDHGPVCPPEVATFSVTENTGPGFTVGTFLATDRDINMNAQLTFSIAGGNLGGHFRIRAPASPAINTSITIETTDVPLDRETTESVTLTIQAVDGGSPSRACIGQILINVLDTNDNCPLFTLNSPGLPTPIFNIREDLGGDVEIVRFVAVDVDVNEGNRIPITYAISTITPAPDIIMDPLSAGVHAQNIDYERIVEYNIVVTAADMGTPAAMTCTGSLTIRIIDVNDNPPTAPDVSVNIFENSLPGVFVARVVGSDVDTGLGGQIRYTLIDGNIGSAFQINFLDGTVSVLTNVIDRETLDEYTLTIELNDLGTPVLTSTSTVSITILDVNDNFPLFPQASYFWNISEGSLPGQAFIDVAASDIDLAMNAEIDYAIAPAGNTGLAFEATVEGHIRAVATLDRETTSYYSLTVMAMDRGTPSLMTTTMVFINITDINDNTPVIIPFLSTAGVCEHDAIGTAVHTFSGIDADLGINAVFYFNLSDTHDPLPFALTSAGELTISRDIDLETIVNQQCDIPHYFLTVQIIDNGTVETIDHTRSSVGHINISVCDINDHIPRFTDRELRVCVNENHTIGASVYTFTATDDDCEPQNIELYFFLVGGASASYFTVDVLTGTLILAQPLDRETQDLHEIFVAVTNFNIDPATNDYQLASVSTTTVCVEDYNDNPPQCLLNPYVIPVSHDIPYGEDFSTILTTDVDLGNHSVIQYSLLENDVPFTIERETGIISTTALLHDKIGNIYEATVLAYDNYNAIPSLSTTCLLRVYVVSNEFRIIVTISLPIEFVRSNIAIITNIFFENTGCLFGVDMIRQKMLSDTSLDYAQTDLIIHGIDPVTFRLKPRQPIIELIDRQYSSINASIFRAVNAPITTVRPFRVDINEVEQNLLVYWIIIAFLLALALIGCCCFICCFCWERRRRRLAHKELKSVVSLDQFEHTDTGIYQNPLWVQPYAEWQEESQSQEIVIDVEDEPVSEVNMIYASQELEIPVTHTGEDEESDDEQKNVQPPSYSDSHKSRQQAPTGSKYSTKESSGSAYHPGASVGKYSSSSSYKRTSGAPQVVAVDSYEDMPANLAGGGTAATRTVSYKKTTTSFKKTVEAAPENIETVTVTQTTSGIETENEKAGLLSDDQMMAFNFDEDSD